VSFLSFLQTTEADVVKVFIAIKNEEVVLQKQIDASLRWVADNSGTITSDLLKVEGIVTALGLGSNPAVGASMLAATVAANEFIAFSKAYSAGQSTAATVASGYKAYTQTKAAVAVALAAATAK